MKQKGKWSSLDNESGETEIKNVDKNTLFFSACERVSEYCGAIIDKIVANELNFDVFPGRCKWIVIFFFFAYFTHT